VTAVVLPELLRNSARATPGSTAIEEDGGATIRYDALEELSDRLAGWLAASGVLPGDRIAVHVAKSIDAVASILGILKAGAAYVPVDPHGPPSRNAYIIHDCGVRVLIAEARLADNLKAELEALGTPPPVLRLESAGGGEGLRKALDAAKAGRAAPVAVRPGDLAYILYTSGSTGRPKGVMISHRNALDFIHWCSDLLSPRPDDRFSSHAPFHFDLSILDLYVPLKHGATVVLVGTELGKDPARLARFIAERKLTIWYSVPSILSLLVPYGDLPKLDFTALRVVNFAGEVFPVKALRALQRAIPHPRYLNLYGPTETNVCTWHPIPDHVPDDREDPYPIGKTCPHYEYRIVDEAGRDVPKGEEGELCMGGPGVMQGYWNLPELTAKAFLVDEAGKRWYRTGDVVIPDGAGDFVFRGRRDRMVKKRGFRIELGEIESCLHAHPEVRAAAVVAIPGDDGVRVRACICSRSGEKLSLVALKTFCSGKLPQYMVPDEFRFYAALPMTSTDKVDYVRLKSME
jgi:amino acid adenylation domain-containing protein